MRGHFGENRTFPRPERSAGRGTDSLEAGSRLIVGRVPAIGFPEDAQEMAATDISHVVRECDHERD
jgi:hypothetical protein